jgi:hypothetical protein
LQEGRSPAVTEIVEIANRATSSRSTTAGAKSPRLALDFVKRFA